jgi:two-component system response regulator PilR (NtrC family)
MVTKMRKLTAPIIISDKTPEIKKREPAVEPPLKKLARVLVVDDDAMMRMVIRNELEEHDVSVANDGIQALELFKNGDFDLVVTDLKMPMMGGMELLAEIMQINPEAKVIVISGYMDCQTKKMLEQMGAVAVLEKPMGVIELNEHVAKILLN